MHDPEVVAFDIRRPWPQRDRWHNSRNPQRTGDLPRFQWQRHGPWWKPGSWSPFCTLFGRGWYFPGVITVWHVEPGGRDSGEVCRQYRRWQDDDGKWQMQMLRGWRWHVHHWQIQVSPLQQLRRWALTRCAWCGGRSRKGDCVNVSMQWDGPRGKWWRGEPGLFHGDCTSVYSAHKACLCVDPLLAHQDYGRCALCGKFRAWRQGPRPEADEATRILAALPAGARQTPEIQAQVRPLWVAAHARDDERRKAGA